MSVFAIRVYTGKEIEVKHMLKQVLERKGQDLVKAIHAFETFTQVFHGEEVAPKHFKSAVPGYIFVELAVNFHRLPSELWYVIKSVPRVCQVFKDNIPEQEFSHFFQSVDVEPDIEVSSSQVVEDPESKQTEALHQANMARTPAQRKKEFESLDDQTKTNVDQVAEWKRKTSHSGALQKMLERCKALIRRKKETFVFPFTLFHKTRDRVDPDKDIAVSRITDGDWIIPELLKTLTLEMQQE